MCECTWLLGRRHTKKMWNQTVGIATGWWYTANQGVLQLFELHFALPMTEATKYRLQSRLMYVVQIIYCIPNQMYINCIFSGWQSIERYHMINRLWKCVDNILFMKTKYISVCISVISLIRFSFEPSMSLASPNKKDLYETLRKSLPINHTRNTQHTRGKRQKNNPNNNINGLCSFAFSLIRLSVAHFHETTTTSIAITATEDQRYFQHMYMLCAVARKRYTIGKEKPRNRLGKSEIVACTHISILHLNGCVQKWV